MDFDVKVRYLLIPVSSTKDGDSSFQRKNELTIVILNNNDDIEVRRIYIFTSGVPD